MSVPASEQVGLGRIPTGAAEFSERPAPRVSILTVLNRRFCEAYSGDEIMKYLTLIKHSESYRSQPIPQGLLDAMGPFVEAGLKSGVIKDTAGLKPTAEGFRVRSSGGKLRVTDGPFTEAKEIVGGYALLEVTSREEALQIAREFMELHRVHWPAFEAECEVRPVEEQ